MQKQEQEYNVNDLLHDCLFPVLLGSNAASYACARLLEKRYRVDSTVLTGRFALTMRFLPHVKLISAPPVLSDGILLRILEDVGDVGSGRIPLLLLCDDAYRGFVVRNKKELEAHFVLREARELLGKGDEDREAFDAF